MNWGRVFIRRIFTRARTNASVEPEIPQVPLQDEQNTIEDAVAFAVIGYPNAGKSTLINAFMKTKLCAASKRVHTTKKAQGILFNYDQSHIMLFDTPGILSNWAKKKFKFGGDLDVFTWKPLSKVDVVGLVVDASCPHTGTTLKPAARDLLETLPPDIEQILILNKVDCIKKKDQLLRIVDSFTNKKKDLRVTSEYDFPRFSRIFMVSALLDDGVQDILKYVSQIKPRHRISFSAYKNSERKPHCLVEERVRAAFLDVAPKEVPYQMKYEVDYMNENIFGELHISMNIIVHRKTHLKMIDRPYAQETMRECEKDLAAIFKKPVTLKIIPIFKEKS